MNSDDSQTTGVEQLLERLKNGEHSAREELIACASQRLFNLTRSIKRGFHQVNRWEQTDDIFQRSLIKLHRALGEVEIRDSRHFFRLAATHIRRQLIDLARHYGGPEGIGANHATQIAGNPDQSQVPLHGAYDAVDAEVETPAELAQWCELHAAIESLPDELRETVELLFYHGLSQDDAAQLMGVGVRTVKRYWRSAKLALFEKLGDQLPEID